MSGERIDFPSGDPARFNALRDRWRETAAATKLPTIAHRIASILPSFVNRERGCAWPTDEQLAEKIGCCVRAIGKGLLALDQSDLIERETVFRKGATREADGRQRLIRLTLPTERPTLGKGVNGPVQVNGPNQSSERPTVGRIYVTDTPDSKEVATNVEITICAPACMTPGQTPARKGLAGVYHGDTAFLDAFDREVVEATDRRMIGAGEIGAIVRAAFDKATLSDPTFMPFDWESVLRLQSKATGGWFIDRAGQLINRHRTAA